MPLIILETLIQAPKQIVFDISRSVDVHQFSMTHHNEKIIAGVSKGLMQKGDTVTWRADHFFKTRKLQVAITALQPYQYFRDEMIAGDFKTMRHDHYFEAAGNTVKMTDHFYFEAPFGIFGKFAESLFLTNYMTRLLIKRNETIRQVAESNQWKQYITE